MHDKLIVDQLTVCLKQKEGFITTVDGLSFDLHPGETVALLGESGCGKSITSLALMRLLPNEAVYGPQSQVLLDNNDILNLPEVIMRQLRGRRLAMIFQEPMTSLNPVLTIEQQLAEAFSRHEKRTHAQLREQMIKLLMEVEISEPERRLQQYPHQLSGGQKQRIVIAMALAGKPDVLIADEPTTALDVSTQTQLLILLKSLQQRYQMSILFITHDFAVVKHIAHRICVMYAGQLVESAPTLEFIRQPKHPYAQQLLMSLPSFAKRHERLKAIPGSVPSLDAIPSGCRFHPRCAHAFAPCKTEIPELQQLSDTQWVRCHLYPEHDAPPPLTNDVTDWPAHAHQDDILLSVKDLTVAFKSSQRRLGRRYPPFVAVDEVTFELRKGRTLALVGESGSGKSTICKAVLRLQPINAGEIKYQDVNIESLHGRALHAFRKKVQIIFQDPFSSMNPRMTIGEIIAEGMQAQGMPSSRIALKQSELLDLVNLPQQALTRYPHQFSGGQRQRICIARALATEPEVLVCDEPTSALDVSVQAQILNLLKSLQLELGLAYLFITHNMGVVSYMADEVLVLRAGKVVESGTCAEILSNPKAAYTQSLVRSMDVTLYPSSPMSSREELRHPEQRERSPEVDEIPRVARDDDSARDNDFPLTTNFIKP